MTTLPLNPFRLKWPFRGVQRIRRPPKHYLSICAIFKNEAPYLKEWIEFHRLVGIEKFYLYNNNSTDDYANILRPYIADDIVVLTHWADSPGQKQAYEDFIIRFRAESYWTAFIDVDEFLLGTHEDSVADILKSYEHFSGVKVNWLVFGSSGHTAPPQGLVTENYTRRADWNHSKGEVSTWPEEINPRKGFVSKMIVQMSAVKSVISPHVFEFRHGYAVNERQERIRADRTPTLNVNRIRIHHYFWKSREEYRSRIAKGSATGRERNPRLFEHTNRNDLEDTTILRFVPRLKKSLSQPTDSKNRHE